MLPLPMGEGRGEGAKHSADHNEFFARREAAPDDEPQVSDLGELTKALTLTLSQRERGSTNTDARYTPHSRSR